MFEVEASNEPSEFSIVVGARSIDGPDVRGVFVPSKVEPDLKDEFVDLGVEFCSKEGHSGYNFITFAF